MQSTASNKDTILEMVTKAGRVERGDRKILALEQTFLLINYI